MGFVTHKIRTVETHDLHYSSIEAIAPGRFDTLITYTREWVPAPSVTDNKFVRWFLQRFYQWEPDISVEQCRELGLEQIMSWSIHGQTVAVYEREPMKNAAK